MLPTQEDIKAIEAHLKRIGVACTHEDPSGVVVQPAEHHTLKCVEMCDDGGGGTYSVNALLALLPEITDPEWFWQEISPAEVGEES